jgi:uncharacterized protein (DUF1330 family)
MRNSRLSAVAALALLVGCLLGAGGMQALQQKPLPVAYVISEIELTNPGAYAKGVPLANKALAASGQKRLASGDTTVPLAGEAPATRIVLPVLESLDAVKAGCTSPANVKARKVGNHYPRLRIFAVEGL